MKFHVKIDGVADPVIVDVLSDENGVVRAQVDGRDVIFDSAHLPDGRQLITQDGRQNVVHVIGGEGQYELLSNEASAKLTVCDERDTWLGTGAGSDGSGTVSVAMPGRVVAVFVEAGQSVKQGDRLLVIEAMKMENDVKAPRDGVVKAVCVADGDSVESAQPLVELE